VIARDVLAEEELRRTVARRRVLKRGERRDELTRAVPSFKATSGWSSKASDLGVERRRGRGLKARRGRRETTGKVLKDRRSPRRRGRMGTSVQNAPCRPDGGRCRRGAPPGPGSRRTSVGRGFGTIWFGGDAKDRIEWSAR
jgi:hypothetical protein